MNARRNSTGPPAAGGGPAFPAAPLDRPTKLATFAVAVTLLVAVPVLALGGGAAPPLAGGVLGAVVAGLLVGAWAFGPAGYDVADGRLRVRRRAFGSREFRLTGAAQRAPAVLGLGLRFGGTGGLFGWTGTFWHAGAGRYRAYYTDRARLVACRTDAGLVVVSPADPEAFLRAARRSAARAGG